MPDLLRAVAGRRVGSTAERAKEGDMSEENVVLVRGGYDDFNSGNVEGVLARLHPDVEWIEPGGGNSPAGTFTSPESVGNDVFAKVAETFDEFSCTAEDARDEGDTVVISAHFRGQAKSGAELDMVGEHVWEVRDGKVVRFENKVDQEAWSAAWS
jgi:uncharacterized protein